MLIGVGRELIRRRWERRLLMLAAAFIMLGAVYGTSAMTPGASAQACCWPWQTSFTGYGGWGGGLLGNNWWGGYNNYSPYSSYGYNGYSPFSYGYGYGYSPYSSYGYGGAEPFYYYGYSPSYYSPIYSSPGLGTAYTMAGSGGYALNPPGVAVTNPPQQYPSATTIVGSLLDYQAYSISGQYCKDKSGGIVYVNSGAPIPAGLNCGGQTGSSTYAPSLGGAQYSVAPTSLASLLYP